MLFSRSQGMRISGDFNIYPDDLEAVLRQHPAVADCPVVGVPGAEWGEMPVSYVERRAGASDSEDIRGWLNGQVGKILNRDLRDAWR